MTYLGLIVSAVLVNNVVLTYFLGACPAITATRHPRTAVAVGLAATLVITVTTLLAWMLRTWVLEPLGIEFLEILFFLFLAWGVGHYLGVLIELVSRTLAVRIGRYLPLVTTTCLVVGVILIVTRSDYTAMESLVAGIASGAGFILVSFLMATIQERLAIERVPRALRGVPIAIISAGLIALAFLAFDRALLQAVIG
jgi:electron transport complex protein RnfA